MRLGRVDGFSRKLQEQKEHGSVEEVRYTREAFKQVAEILKPYVNTPVGKDIAKDFANLFARDNPRFDRDRFFRAAGINPATIEGHSSHKTIEYGNDKPAKRTSVKVERDFVRYSFGLTPEDVIYERLPDYYNMDLNRRDAVTILKAVKATGDKAFIDRMTDEFGGGDIDKFIRRPKEMLGPGKCLVSLDPDTMIKLLDALARGDEEAMGIRGFILATLDIEEV